MFQNPCQFSCAATIADAHRHPSKRASHFIGAPARLESMHNKFDAVLFDLDGTLTDSGQGIVRSVQFALESLGVKAPPEEELRWCIGPPVRENLRRLLATSDSALIERGVTLYLERYEKIGFRENRVYDGINEILAAL